MKFRDLPSIIPLHVASGTVLLPRAQLPLLLDSPQDKAAVDCSFRNGNRFIGVVQDNPEGGYFQKGCLGQIMNFQDGSQLFLTLKGVCRFEIEHLTEEQPILKAKVDYEKYESDLEEMAVDPLVDRQRLLALLKGYLDDHQIATNWDEINHASDDLIISSLTMVCPFKPIEKQALLEVPSLAERCHIMIALMEMASPDLKREIPVLH